MNLCTVKMYSLDVNKKPRTKDRGNDIVKLIVYLSFELWHLALIAVPPAYHETVT